MSDPPPDQSGHTSGGYAPTTEQIDRIAAAIEADTRERKAAQTENSQHTGDVHWWARVSAVAVIIYTLITIGVLVASIRSIQEARRATHYASRAALAATQQAETAEATAVRQLRPYVSMRLPSFKCPSCAAYQEGASPKVSNADFFEAEFTNHGLTPAYAVRVRTCFTNVPPPVIDTIPDLPPCEEKYGTFTMTLYPNTPRPSISTIEMSHFIGAYRGQNVYIHYGDVAYTDTFRCRRNTPYCFMVGKFQSNVLVIAACPGNYNAPTDDKCEK